MPLRYSCFISYRSTQGDIVQELVSSLKTELGRWSDLDVYVDTERLDGGDFFNRELAKALCESACLIVVYTPTYFSKQHIYCALEYKAMEILEEERLMKLDLPVNDEHGLIIPLVYRGDTKLPESIRNQRQYHVFEAFQLSGKDNLDNPDYAVIIRKIAEYIEERCEELQMIEEDVCACCSTFEFPEEEEIANWLEGMLPPKPVLPGRKGE